MASASNVENNGVASASAAKTARNSGGMIKKPTSAAMAAHQQHGGNIARSACGASRCA